MSTYTPPDKIEIYAAALMVAKAVLEKFGSRHAASEVK